MTAQLTQLMHKNAAVVNAWDGVFLAPRSDVVTEHLIEFGSHTGPLLELALTSVSVGDAVIDVGAHIGTYTIPLARKVGPTGRVLAFEPNPATREMLELNVELNDLGHVVTVLDVGVGSATARGVLEGGRSNTGATHMRDVETDDGDVRIETLDDHDTAPTFIKIDTEGFELHGLMGAEETLTRSTPSLLLAVDEAHLGRYGQSVRELDDFLRARGYRLFTHRGKRNAQRRDFDLVEINELMGNDEMFDVLAVHETVAPRWLGHLDATRHTAGGARDSV